MVGESVISSAGNFPRSVKPNLFSCGASEETESYGTVFRAGLPAGRESLV